MISKVIWFANILVNFINNKIFLFSFYHSLNTVTSFFIVLVIAFFLRLFELGQHLVTQCYMLVISSSNHSCELVLMRISVTGATLSMIVVSFPMKSESAQLMSVNFKYSGNLAFSSSCRYESLV